MSGRKRKVQANHRRRGVSVARWEATDEFLGKMGRLLKHQETTRQRLFGPRPEEGDQR